MQTVSSASTYMTTGAGEKKMAAETHTVCRGECSIDWKETMKLVRASAYEQPFVMEVSKPEGEDCAHYLKARL